MSLFFQQALIYDTRDFGAEDPTKGVYFEIGNEYSSKLIGSEFNFDKLLIQAKTFHKLPYGQRTVLAGRLAVGNIFGSEAPFFEYQDQWSPDGSINALGGARSLRGFRAEPVHGTLLWFTNWELRTRLAERKIGSQRFALSVVPFLDAGTVRDRWQSLDFRNVRYSYGVGGRLAWNQSTIITLDIGRSKEDKFLFFGIGHSF
ncbi:MAG: BamA/TamA family outer membrane protein [Armatimonas sp.]